MTTIKPPICIACRHLDRSSVDTWPRLRCVAFVHGVPLDIAQSKVEHRGPYPGDGGIRFEQAKDRPRVS